MSTSAKIRLFFNYESLPQFSNVYLGFIIHQFANLLPQDVTMETQTSRRLPSGDYHFLKARVNGVLLLTLRRNIDEGRDTVFSFKITFCEQRKL